MKRMGLPDIPFTAQNASINRVRIVDLPGIEVDESVIGEQAYNLLSAPAVVKNTLNHSGELKLPKRYQTGNLNRIELRRDLPRFLDTCLKSPHPVVRSTSHEIARQLGRNLGYVLLTLHRGDAVNRQARDDWTTREWDQWHTTQEIRVGGGIVSGSLGNHMIDEARKMISSNGYRDVINLEKSHYPRAMTIIGASRYLPSNARFSLCLDFGHTSVKAKVAQFDSGVLMHLFSLPSHDVGWSWRNDTEARNEIDPHEVLQFVTREVICMWKNVSGKGIYLDRDIMVSIAAYVRGGHLLGNGIYARMSLLANDVRALLEKGMWEDARIDAKVHLIHDGTAAAAMYAGEKNTAILVLGTALGVGFAPRSAKQLRSVSSGLQQQSLT